jgi:hypothetical protein
VHGEGSSARPLTRSTPGRMLVPTGGGPTAADAALAWADCQAPPTAAQPGRYDNAATVWAGHVAGRPPPTLPTRADGSAPTVSRSPAFLPRAGGRPRVSGLEGLDPPRCSRIVRTAGGRAGSSGSLTGLPSTRSRQLCDGGRCRRKVGYLAVIVTRRLSDWPSGVPLFAIGSASPRPVAVMFTPRPPRASDSAFCTMAARRWDRCRL